MGGFSNGLSNLSIKCSLYNPTGISASHPPVPEPGLSSVCPVSAVLLLYFLSQYW